MSAERISIAFLGALVLASGAPLAGAAQQSPSTASETAPKPEIREPTAEEERALSEAWRLVSWFQAQGSHANALQRLAEAEAILERTWGPSSPVTLHARVLRAISLGATGKYDASDTLLKGILPALERRVGRAHNIYRRAVLTQTDNAIRSGWLQRADTLLQSLNQTTAATFGAASLEHAEATANLAHLRLQQGRYADAERLDREALSVRERFLKPDDPLLPLTRARIALALAGQGRFPDAETLVGSAVASWKDPKDAVAARLAEAVGDIHAQAGKLPEAEAAYRKALPIMIDRFGLVSPEAQLVGAKLREALLLRGLRFQPLGRVSTESIPDLDLDLVSILKANCKAAEQPRDMVEFKVLENTALFSQQFEDIAHCHRTALKFADERLGREHPTTAMVLLRLSDSLHREGRTDEAEVLVRRAVDIREKKLGKAHPDTALAMSLFGSILAAQGRTDEAAALAQRASAGLAPLRGAALALEADIERATQLDAQGRHREAGEIWTKHASISPDQAKGDLNLLFKFLGGYSFNRQALGTCDRSIHEPLKKLHEQLKSTWYGVWENPLAEAWAQSLACVGDLKQAAEVYRGIAALQRGKVRGWYYPGMALVEARRAITLARDPQTQSDAVEAARSATMVARERRYTISRDSDGNSNGVVRLTGERASDPLALAFYASIKANWEVSKGREDIARGFFGHGWTAFESAQDLGLSTAGQALLQAGVRSTVKDPALAELVRRHQQLSAEVTRLDRAIIAAEGNAGETERQQFSAAKAQLDALTDAIRKSFPGYAELVRPAALGVKQVRERLKAGEGLLYIQPAGDEVYTFAIGAEGFAWTRVRMTTSELNESVRALRCGLDTATCQSQRQSETPFDLKLAHRLYAELVAPVETPLKGAKQLFVVSGGDLGGLPLSVLLTAPPAPAQNADDLAALATLPWLADRYAMVTLPSVSSLRAIEQIKARAHQAELVGFGDPVLGPPRASVSDPLEVKLASIGVDLGPSRGVLANPASIKELPSLPGTRTELKAVAAALNAPPAAIRLGLQATEAAVKGADDLRGARVVMFATHGVLPRSLAGVEEPGLIFTPPASATPQDDGVLTASETAALTLNADWVILSACNTAAADGRPSGESLSGLARSFLFAGARSLLASHWQVGDQVTAMLTVEALRGDGAGPGLGRSAALQQAMRAVRTGTRADGSRLEGWRDDFAHPSAWAPFVLVESGN